MLKQGPAISPANALAYELYVDGKLSDDKKRFEIIMQAQNKFLVISLQARLLIFMHRGNMFL
jgi:hypothetical protein